MTGFTIGQKQGGHPVTGIFVRNNAPPTGFYANECPAGGLVLDIVAGVLYQNSGTIASPTFIVYGTVIPSGATLPAVVNASNLPTSDPHSTGSLYASNSVVTVSAG